MSAKKIATLSYHRAINYGAILQVYALQKKIEEFGAECTVIDYRNSKLEDRHNRMKLSDCNSFKDYIRYFLLSKNYNSKHHKFREFSKNYLKMSNSYYDISSLKKIIDRYDKFICGSDQVWNYNINGFDDTYFLSFLKDKNKKNAFAASFGFEEIPTKYKKQYYEFLKDYNTLTVREKHGADIIEDLVGYRPKVVLDPTMLISKKEWYSFANEYNNKNKYILIYGFSGKNNMMDLAKNIAKKTGYEILIIGNSYLPSFNIKYEKTAGPKDFLGIFKNAEYILTNSFHGTAFSIKLNKEFFTELLPESRKINSRLEHVLELFELRHRLITDSNPEIIENNINYDRVNERIKKEKEKSINCLRKIIED